MLLKDIAAQLGVPDSRVRKWKTEDKWEVKRKGALLIAKRSAPKRSPGAPKGNKNALGNQGGAPKGNRNAEKFGFFSRIFPDDPETREIVESIDLKSPLDILWENIVIQYTAIARAQKLMFVKDQADMTKELKREKRSEGPESESWEKEWELQHAWDKHATFLQAQSRAIATLQGLIGRYEEMLPNSLEREADRLRIEKLKAEVAALKADNGDADDEPGLPGLMRALQDSVDKR